MLQNRLWKNIKSKGIFTLLVMFISINLHAAELTAIPKPEVEKLHRDLLNAEIDTRKEALIKLQWAGISDEKVFDPIVEKIQSNKKIAPKYAKIYISALTYSGNPKYLTFLENLSQDTTYSRSIRKLAETHKSQFDRYQSISKLMNDSNSAVGSEEFWAKRYEKGLRVADNVRMRWAARDLYLSGLNESSYNTAKIFLSENYKTKTDDPYIIDSMSFLCKSLGLSRNTKYKDILIEVANNTPNKKLSKYAERSVQYFDRNFKANNPALKKS